MTSNQQQRDNIVDVIRTLFKQREDGVAVSRANHDSITYSELLKKVEKQENKLAEIGFKPHDRVALFCEDSVEYIVMALAILGTNAVIVPVSPSLSSNELVSLCKRIKVRYLVSEKEFKN